MFENVLIFNDATRNTDRSIWMHNLELAGGTEHL